jgi:signal recognition particle subunit SRP72
VLVLRIAPGDKDATQTKLFLLLQTEKYVAALDMIEKEEGKEHAFERAYALYRLQREQQAREVLDELRATDPDDRGVIHLEAQLVRMSTSATERSLNGIIREGLSKGRLRQSC